MRRTLASVLFILLTLAAIIPSMSAQQVDKKLPWSVRMTQSEMIRCPESWQLDFQPKLKWDYCHGLELGAMLDVYDTYGDKKIRDYAIAYADTMVHADGTITAYKLTDYSLDRINSGKILFRIYEQTKDPKYKKALDLLYSQFEGQPRNEQAAQQGDCPQRDAVPKAHVVDFVDDLLRKRRSAASRQAGLGNDGGNHPLNDFENGQHEVEAVSHRRLCQYKTDEAFERHFRAF